jgi:hypothetical protein
MENPTWLIFFLIVAGAGILLYGKSNKRPPANPSSPQTPQQQQAPNQQVPRTLWEKIKADVTVIAIVVIALATLETIAWMRIPILWSLIYDTLHGFLIFNLGVVVAAWLGSIKQVDKDGKKTDKSDPVASKASWVVWFIVILSLVPVAIRLWGEQGYVKMAGLASSSHKTYVVGDVSSSKFDYRDVPESDAELEKILDGIGKIESDNQHIDPKTGAPIRNKEGSSAIGELQIMESLHDERAKALGYDIRTREGNRGYGKHLLRTLGTTPWEVDPRSFGKLVSQVGLYRPKSQFATRERIYALVSLEPGKWSDTVPVINQPGIYGRYVFSWVATFTEGKGEARECQVAFNGKTERPFPFLDFVDEWDYAKDGKKETFQYICKDKATVTLRLVPPG